jgi:hypothetical protein
MEQERDSNPPTLGLQWLPHLATPTSYPSHQLDSQRDRARRPISFKAKVFERQAARQRQLAATNGIATEGR